MFKCDTTKMVAAIKAMGPKGKAALRKGLRAGAKIILAQARANAPVKSGNLKKAIKIKTKRSKHKVIITVGIDHKDARYGSIIEMGGIKIQARNMLLNASKDKKEEAKEIVYREISQALGGK